MVFFKASKGQVIAYLLASINRCESNRSVRLIYYPQNINFL